MPSKPCQAIVTTKLTICVVPTRTRPCFSSALYVVIAFWRSERGRLLQDCKITSVDLDFIRTMQILSIKLVCLFIIFGGLQPTQLSALYGKFFEMLVLSSNSDYHPNKKKYFLMFLEQTQQWIFMIIKMCFGSIFPPKKIEVGSHLSFCWTWPRMACCDICSIWICSHRLFFYFGTWFT